MKNRIISFLLILCMVFSTLPVSAFAAEETVLDDFSIVGINPLYADIITEENLIKPNRTLLYSNKAIDDEYYTAEAAGAQIRDDLVARDVTVSVNAYCESSVETYEADAEKLVFDILEHAMAHTGDPVEGDYLRWHYEGFDADLPNAFLEDGKLYMTITYTMTYLTTAAQEAEMDAAVENLLNALGVSQADDYTKLKAVYDFICSEIVYDYKNSYLLKHTAYAALVNRTAVCQGYATLLYRLALSLGVDCRLIPGRSNGDNHGWNIAELDDLYYNLDSTWDAGNTEYQFFLVAPANFNDHTRFADYDTASFHAEYPMAAADYVYDEPEDSFITSGTCGKNLTWTLDEEGTLIISGTGSMYEYSNNNVPWMEYNNRITVVTVEEGVTTLSPFAFSGCKILREISLPSTLITIGGYAFRDCDSLTQIDLPENLQKIEGSAFHSCDLLTSLTILSKVTELGSPLAENSKNLKTITFTGDAPKIGENTFRTYGDELTVRYPAGNRTWDAVIGKNYGFSKTVEWIPVCPGHRWVEATCTTAKQCSVCGVTEGTEKGHAYTAVVTVPTCTQKGYTTYTCTCGDTYIADEITELGHNEVIDNGYSSTCTEDGLTDGVHCERCSTVLSDQIVITALGHNWDEGVVTTEPTEENTGILTYTCETCGDTKTEVIPALEHEHVYKSVVTAPTCTAAGYTTYTCACGHSYTGNEVSSLEHSWDDGKVTTAPTEDNTGIRTYTCENCGDTKTEVIPALEHVHAYKSVVTAPTCTAGGYTTYSCACGDNYIGNQTAATGHSYKNGICGSCGTADPDYEHEKELFKLAGANMVLANNLAMNFYINTADIDVDEDYYAVITKKYADREDLVVTIQDEDWEKYSSTYYRVALNLIAAKEMADEITVVIYNDEDKPVSKVWEDSVRDYTMRGVNKEMEKENPDEKLMAVYVEMLNYGAAAQENFGYNVDDLANNELTEAHQAYGIGKVEMKDYRVSTGAFAGTSLTLESNILMNFYFNIIPADYDGLKAVVTYTDHTGKPKEFKIKGEDFVKNNATTWGVTLESLVVADCRQPVTVKVYDANDNLLSSVTDSVEGYAARRGEADALSVAIMTFADAAYNTFH